MTIREKAPDYRAPSGWNALLPRRIAKEEIPRERRFRNIVVGAG